LANGWKSTPTYLDSMKSRGSPRTACIAGTLRAILHLT
jgi:hypothetical protein